VELVRSRVAALERGELDALFANVTEDFEYVNPDYALEPGTRYGPEGGRIALQNLLDAFEEVKYNVERLEERGDRVIVTGTWAGRGKVSGVSFEGEPFAVVVTFRGDQVTRLEWFNQADEALRAT